MLMSFLRLSRSSRYSLRRPSSSRPCMAWNSSTSGPSGVSISMTLGMVFSDGQALLDRTRDRFRRPDDETGNRDSSFEAELASLDVWNQPHVGQQTLDVLSAMRVAAVRLQRVRAYQLG